MKVGVHFFVSFFFSTSDCLLLFHIFDAGRISDERQSGSAHVAIKGMNLHPMARVRVDRVPPGTVYFYPSGHGYRYRYGLLLCFACTLALLRQSKHSGHALPAAKLGVLVPGVLDSQLTTARVPKMA